MSHISIRDVFGRRPRPDTRPAGRSAVGLGQHEPGRERARGSRWIRRALLTTVLSLVVLLGGTVAGGYLYVNSYFSDFHRIGSLTALTAAHQPVMPAATRKSMTILLLGTQAISSNRNHKGVLGSSTNPQALGGLIALVHLNADRKAASVVSIPPTAQVNVPRHGRMQLWRTLPIGGPSLLITTVMRLTNVRIDHYGVFSYDMTVSLVQAIGGVDVLVKTPFCNQGVCFHSGVNHLTASMVRPYLSRSKGVSQIGRNQLQLSLLRAFITKAGRLGPSDTIRVAKALANVLSLDSNFTNSELMTLTFQLRNMHGRNVTFVNAPTVNGSPTKGGLTTLYLKHPLSDQLWQAIRHDAVAAFARLHPETISPIAPF